MLICVTGVSGVGKSTVLDRASGVCPIVVLDRVVHALYAPGQAGWSAVREAFGAAYATKRGVDREKLGRLVFCDPRAMALLNAAVFPPVSVFLARLRRAASRGVVVVEAAAYLTNRDKYAPFFDRVVLITAPEKRVLDSNAERFPGVSDFRDRVFGRLDSGPFDLTLHNGGDPGDAAAALRAFITPFLPSRQGF